MVGLDQHGNGQLLRIKMTVISAKLYREMYMLSGYPEQHVLWIPKLYLNLMTSGENCLLDPCRSLVDYLEITNDTTSFFSRENFYQERG